MNPLVLILAGGGIASILIFLLITFVNWREDKKLGKRRQSDWNVFPLVLAAFCMAVLSGCVDAKDPVTGKTIRTLSPAARAALTEAFDAGVKVAREKLNEATGVKAANQK